MKYFVALIFAVMPMLLRPCVAQTPQVPDSLATGTEAVADTAEEKVMIWVEHRPSFPGGEDSLMTFLRKNIIYPPNARLDGISGLVVVSCIVEKNGKITNAKVAQDIGGGCGEEVLRVVRKMPRWTPGRQRGKSVRCMVYLPFNFSLEEQ